MSSRKNEARYLQTFLKKKPILKKTFLNKKALAITRVRSYEGGAAITMLQAVGTGREKSFCIELTAELYGQLEAIAEKQGSKLEDEVAEAIKAYIERMRAYRDDPFFHLGKAGKSGLKDLAKAHDTYLYGTGMK
jgi:hypothetical protein